MSKLRDASDAKAPLWRLSLDSWSVVAALAAAALVKLHVLNAVKW